jgi:FkbM family methyltransferase
MKRPYGMVKLLLLRTITSKIDQYRQEVEVCFKLGADFWSRVSLVLATILFHAANGFRIKRYPDGTVPKRYLVRFGGRPVDLLLRTYGGDLYLLHEIFLSRTYWIPLSWRRPVATVVDLGANVGLATLFLSQYFPTARFVCVEPNPANTAILKQNISSLGELAQVIEGAVNASSGEAWFEDSVECWRGRLCQDRNRGRLVRCYTMEEILTACDLSTIDVLKVDIEGAEQQLFGTRNGWLSKVKVIIVELHGAYSIQDFEGDVTPFGLKVFPPNMEHGNRTVFALSSEMLRANNFPV